MAHSLPPTYQEATNPLLGAPSAHAMEEQSLVIEYMLSPAAELNGKQHPALNTQEPALAWDKEKGQFVEANEIENIDYTVLYKDAEIEKDCFKEAMDTYLKSETKNPDAKYDISKFDDLGPQDCIKVVMGSISEVQKKYEIESIKGPWGKVRQAFRRLGENSAVFESWLMLLPSENNYLSVLCGGLKLILRAAARLRKMNEEVVATLCKIPGCLDKCQRLLSITKSSPSLRKCSVNLYSAILRAMGAILDHYSYAAHKRVGMSLLHQNRHGVELSEKLAAIDKCSLAIAEESDICIKEMERDTNIAARSTYRAVGTVQQTVVQGQQRVELAIREREEWTNTERRKLLEETMKEKEAARKENEEAKKSREEATRLLLEVSEIKSMALSETRFFFNANPQLSDFVRAKEDGKLAVVLPESRPVTPTPPQAEITKKLPRFTKKQLLARLSCEKISPKADILANLGHVLRLNIGQQDRVVYAMDRLQPFLADIHSSVLLINGFDNKTQGVHTPLSFVCAKLAHALRDARKSKTRVKSSESKIICLSFFCGEHAQWEDDFMAGPSGILNSFIVQLIVQYKNFDFEQLTEFEKLDCDDIAALTKVFNKLLRQLPPDMIVFCIIENLSQYDDVDRGDGSELLLDNLRKAVHKMAERKRSCSLKLLVTAHRQLFLDAAMKLDDSEKLNLPENLDKKGGFTDLQWDVTAGQRVDELAV